jgi:hypothetical protein
VAHSGSGGGTISATVSASVVPDYARKLSAAGQALLGWRGAVALLVLVIWLVPAKGYRLPVHLPFNLELYRVLVLTLLFAWVVSRLTGGVSWSAVAVGKPIGLLVFAAIAALVLNLQAIQRADLETQALKSLSFFLSYVVVFLLVASTIRSIASIEFILRVLVVGGAIVAVGALYESRTHYDVFEHLHRIVPLLQHLGEDRQNIRFGRLRVRASAQHPIALGAALAMCLPLAVYVCTRAATKLRFLLWASATIVIAMAAVSTVSRTVVLMLGVMVVVAASLRGRQLIRYWPALLAIVVVTHIGAPGAISHLYKAFQPKGGLTSQLQERSGERGSGRLADIGPGIDLWSTSPFVGRALGTQRTTGDPAALAGADVQGPSIIFDDQYMNTLVTLGAVGLVGLVWLVWGAAWKLLGSSRRLRGPASDLLVACGTACAGFGASLLTYDALAFVQATLLFLIAAALGLRAREIALRTG